MPHSSNGGSRTASRRKFRAGTESTLEKFAIRFAEVTLLAGVVGAGVALLVARAG